MIKIKESHKHFRRHTHALSLSLSHTHTLTHTHTVTHTRATDYRDWGRISVENENTNILQTLSGLIERTHDNGKQKMHWVESVYVRERGTFCDKRASYTGKSVTREWMCLKSSDLNVSRIKEHLSKVHTCCFSN